MNLLERLEEDWGLLNMFREEAGTKALNRPMNDLKEAQAEIERLQEALRPFALFSTHSTGTVEYGESTTENRILTREDFDRALDVLVGGDEQRVKETKP